MKRFTCLAGILLLFVSSPVSRSQDASRVIANPIDIDYAFTRRTTGFYDGMREAARKLGQDRAASVLADQVELAAG